MSATRALLTVAVGCAIGVSACCDHALQRDPTRPGMYVGARGAGFLRPEAWAGQGLPPPAPSTEACPNDKSRVEEALGVKAAAACGDIRERPVQGIGDADQPIQTPRAPHCYDLGDWILVVEYEMPQTQCSRMVAVAVLKRK